jgi:hypothetical protein
MKQRVPLKQQRPAREPPPFTQPQAPDGLHKRLDELLDEALKGTFPASDAFDIGRWTEEAARERAAKLNEGAGKTRQDAATPTSTNASYRNEGPTNERLEIG